MKRFLHHIKKLLQFSLLLYALTGISYSGFGQAAGDYRTAATGNWNALATWQTYNGTAWVAASTTPTSANGVITIRNGHTVTVTASVTVDQVTIDAGGQVTVNTTITLTIANGADAIDMIVAGTLVNSGTITTTGALAFNSGSTYQHTQNGGTIPAATWNAASNCNITGITSATSLGGFGQTFGNLTWNCPGQTSNFYIAANVTIAGNFTISGTGTFDSNNHVLRMSETGTGYTITVTGNFVVTNNSSFKMNNSTGSCTLNIGGDFSMNSGYITIVTGNANSTINVSGDVNISGGTLCMDEDASARVGTLNVGGNFSLSGSGVITQITGGSGAINFNGGTTQIYSKTGGTISNIVNFSVISGSTLDVGTSLIDGSTGTFTLSSGAGIITAHSQGLSIAAGTGSIQVTGSKTYNSGANYTYNGTVAQVTGNGLTQNTPANLTINNSAGVTLSAATTISGLLTMTSGSLNMANTDLNVGSLTGSGNLTNSSGTAGARTITIGNDNSSPAAFSGVISNGTATSVAVTKSGTGTLILSGTNTYNGLTTVSGGTLQYGIANALSSGPVALNGGTFSTGATTGYGDALGTLNLTENSSIKLGTGNHSLNFAASNGVSWTAGKTLTVTGWTGSYNGTSGTAGKIFVGTTSTGLTTSQLAQIQFFNGTAYFNAIILATGEVVPVYTIKAGAVLTPPFCVSPTTSVNGTVAYNAGGTYSSATYTAKLSDAAGSFTSPVNIGTAVVTGTDPSGTINITIPAGTASGTGYRIRIDCSTPVVTGNAGSAFEIVNGANDVSSPLSAAGDALVTLSWTNPTGCFDEIMIVAKAGSSVSGIPSGDGTAYTGSLVYGSGTAFTGGGYVVYKGTISPQIVTNLTNGTQYFFKFFTRKGTNWSSGVETNATPVYTTLASDYYRSQATGNWNATATWQGSHDAITWYNATSTPTSAANTITIQNTHTITVTASVSVDQVTVNTGAQVTVNAGQTLTIANGTGTDMIVDGVLVNSGTITTTGTLAFNSGSSYEHARDGGTIPVATWNSVSTCNITGITGTEVTTNLNQTFGNFTWNCPAQTVNPNTLNNMNGISIAGDFNLISTGTGSIRLGSAATRSFTILGNFNISGGTYNLSTGGGTGTIYIKGNFTMSGGTLTETGTGRGAFVLNGTVNQNFIKTGGTISNNIDFSVESGAILNMSTYVLDGSTGAFTLSSGGSIVTANTGGLSTSGATGSIQVSGTRTYNSGANCTYNGTAAQITGNGLTSANNLIINNNTGVALTSSTTIAGTLTLTAGALSIGANTLTLSNAANLSYGTGSLTGGATSNLTIGTGANITLNAISGGLNNFSASRNITLSADLSVAGIVTAQNGTLSSAGNLTLISTASQTALVDGSGSGDITGNVTMQRYLPSGFGYKYFSSPFQAATVNEFGDDMNLGASFPAFYRYDESRTAAGWVRYDTATRVLNPMHGYAVNFGSDPAADTVDVTGVVNNGSLSRTIYNNNNTYTKGFNLVGNPYPSPINWNAASGWTKTNIDNALYYFKASATDQYGGTYSTYIAGVSSDGLATNIIPSMQGVFVHVSDGTYPVTGTLAMNNSVRVTDLTHSFIKSDGSNPGSLLRLAASFADDPASKDPVVIYFDEKALNAFDGQLDALKLMNTDLKVPNLYAMSSDGKKLSISALPFSSDTLREVSLGLKTNKTGTVIFRIRDIEGIFSEMGISFSDKVTGIDQDLLPDNEYSIYLVAGEYQNRFFLNLSNVSTGISDKTNDIDLFRIYSSHGTLKAEINSLPGEDGILRLYSLTGQLIFIRNIYAPGHYEFNPAINEGIYIASYISGSKRSTKKIFIQNR